MTRTQIHHRTTRLHTAGMATAIALTGCATTPADPVAASTDPVYVGPNGNFGLTFLDTSEQRSQTGADWDFLHGKAACGAGEGLVGLSTVPGGDNRTALCRPLGGQFTTTVRDTLTFDDTHPADVRLTTRGPDWARFNYKLECGANEFVLGISENAALYQNNHHIHKLLCGAASGLSNACNTRVVDTRDDRGTGAAETWDWDYGAYKGECDVGQYVAGVSIDPDTRRAHSLLCCTVNASRNNFVTAEGTAFALNGASFRHQATNFQGLAFETAAQATTDLQGAAAAGVREARILIANSALTTAEIIARLQSTIDLARPLGVRLSVVLTGNYGYHYQLWTPVDSPSNRGGQFPTGDDKYLVFNADVRDTHLALGDAWMTGGYREFYLPFVDAVVSHFKDEPTIMAWEVAGEVASVTGNVPNVISFHRDMARHIKAIDPKHLVTAGIISTHQASMTNLADQDMLLGDWAIDYISPHSYDDAEDDSAAARRLSKPYAIAEFGFALPNANQTTYTNRVGDYFTKVYVNQDAVSAAFFGAQYGGDHGDGNNEYIPTYPLSDTRPIDRMPWVDAIWRSWAPRM
jgi:hypothetical protein